MKRKIELNIAWIVWNLLTNLNEKIRRRYERELRDIAMNADDDLLFFKKRSHDLIPF